MGVGVRTVCLLSAAALMSAPALAEAATPAQYRAVERGLKRLVAEPAGPPGAMATFHRGGRTTVVSVGKANVQTGARARAGDHMRIASMSKAFSGAVVLNLVGKGRLGLGDTIGERLPSMPVAWHAVTIRQLLNHTSGVPEYTGTDELSQHLRTNPGGILLPATLLEWVSDEGLDFPPGSKYTYSNSDNVILGLIAERATGKRYENLLASIVFRPTRLSETFMATRTALPRPFIHGYDVTPGQEPEDLSSVFTPTIGWASGGMVSTPLEVGRFFRAYLRGRFFGAAQKRAQRRFVPGGDSVPAGPGRNGAGLALFRYRTRCGTVYGHTGSFPGYAQWAAATADGKRSVTTTLNIQPPPPGSAQLGRLRRVQNAAVCALLRKGEGR